MLAAKKALAKGIQEAILDIGLFRPTNGSKIFSAVKGAIDTGLYIPCDSDIMPDPSSIEGKIISKYADSIDNPYLYEKQFSNYLKNGLRPQDLPDHVSQIKSKIEEVEI
jgi:large subunit ribosomal protein L18